MQITRQGDYAVRSVLYLSRQPFKTISFVAQIAEEYKIPRSFLAKILQKLTKAKIVKSYRGVKGGFSLAKQPKEISLLDVIEAIEGKISLNICLKDKKSCELSKHCPVSPIWAAVQNRFTDVLKNTTFADLARH